MSIKQKVSIPIIGVVIIGLIIATFVATNESRNLVIVEAATGTMRGYRDTVLNALTTLMISGTIKEYKTSFLEQMRHIADVRVLRGDSVDKDYGKGVPDDYPKDEIEKEVMKKGGEKIVLEGEFLRGVFPYIGRSDFMGKNCLSCHNVQEGTVLGVVSIRIPLTRAFSHIRSARNFYFRLGLIGVVTVTGLIILVVNIILNKLAKEEVERKRLLDELGRSNRDLEQFAYAASHDLKEPLRTVVGFLQVLERKYKDKLDSQAAGYIDVAIDGSLRMHKLIEGLLAYSLIARHGAEFRQVGVDDVFEKAVSNLSVAIRESSAIITKDKLPAVLGDETQLMQLLQNLIGNALKFRKSDIPPQIHISANREGREWVFSVRDNGIGIRPEHYEKIFLIFRRLHSRDEYPGTGIGLALCKQIVERHHGRIWVESAKDEGTTFFFTIPVGGRK